MFGEGSIGKVRFQCPGFASEIDRTSGEPIAFEKSGGTFGYASFLAFDPKTGQATIDMCAQENVTAEIARKSGVEVDAVIEKYRDPESQEFDRRKMIATEMPELSKGEEERKSSAVTGPSELSSDEISAAINAVRAALESNGVTVGGSDLNVGNVAGKTSGQSR